MRRKRWSKFKSPGKLSSSTFNAPASGLDVLKEIRASASKVPVLVLSGHPEEQYAVRVLEPCGGLPRQRGAPQELCRAVEGS